MEMKQREVVFIGDRSYSMLALGDAPWKGARNWANGQAKVAKENRTRAFITLVSFDDQIERPLDSVPAGPDSDWKDLSDEVVKEWMKPRGATALYDAFVGEVHALIEKKKNRGEECSAALALFTDGHDTSSTKKLPDMQRAVELAEKENVAIYYLGAGQDAIATGTMYGFSSDRCLSTGTDRVSSGEGYRAANAAMLENRGFTQLERQSSAPPPDPLLAEDIPPPRYLSGTLPPPPYRSS